MMTRMADPNPSSRRKWPRRINRGFLGLLVFLVVGALVTRYVLRWRGQARLAEQVAALDASDPRWRWDEVEFDRMLIPDDENSALLVPEFETAVGGPGAERIHTPPLAQLLTPPKNVFRHPDAVAELEDVLRRYPRALEIARSFADKPRGRHPLDLPADDFLPRGEYLQHLRSAVHLLDMEAELATPADRPGRVRALVRAMWNVAASLDGEPALLSQLVRIGLLNLAVRRVERSLALGCPAGELTPLQPMLLAETRSDYFTPGVRGDRAAANRFLSQIESGTIPVARWTRARDVVASSMAPAGPPPEPDFGVRVSVWATVGTFLPANFATHLDLTTQALRVTTLPDHEQRAALPKLDPGFDPNRVLYKVSRSSIEKLLEGQLRIRALLRCAAVALAVEQYRVQNGRWPTTLAEVPKALLVAVPLDPFDGTPLKFARQPEGVVLYAVGLNGRDEGGENDATQFGRDRQDDVAFRLYDPDRRGLRVTPVDDDP